MSRFTRIWIAVLSLALPPMSSASDENKFDETLGVRLSDCSALFGLLSQSKSSAAESMKAFTLAATGYATVAFHNKSQTEAEIAKSMARLSREISELQENETAFKARFSTCVSVLKVAEVELRPRMDDTMKMLVPEIFGGSHE